MWFKDRKSVIRQQKNNEDPERNTSNNNQSKEQQREQFRVRTDTVGLYRLRAGNKSTSWGECTLADISAGGSKIINNLKLPDSIPQIKIQLQFDLETRFLLDAVIVWASRNEGEYHYGLQWYNISPLELAELQRQLNRLQIKKRKLVKV
jgi:c-di-GMP-binding flagellar brake protein YcgR